MARFELKITFVCLFFLKYYTCKNLATTVLVLFFLLEKAGKSVMHNSDWTGANRYHEDDPDDSFEVSQ